MRVTWIGTICSANTPTNRTLRPRKSTHANAYAASAARHSGMTTAGKVMTIELTNDWPRLIPLSEPSTVR